MLQLFKNLFRKQQKKDRLLIFVGDYACSLLNEHYSEITRDSYILAVSTNYTHLEKCENIDKSDKLFIGFEKRYHCGDRDFESGRAYAMKAKRQLLKSIKSKPARDIFIIGSLRFCSASGIIAELSMICKKHNIPIKHIISTPLKSEGQLAEQNSKQALEIIKNCSSNAIIINPEELNNNGEKSYLIRSLNQSFLEMLIEK